MSKLSNIAYSLIYSTSIILWNVNRVVLVAQPMPSWVSRRARWESRGVFLRVHIGSQLWAQDYTIELPVWSTWGRKRVTTIDFLLCLSRKYFEWNADTYSMGLSLLLSPLCADYVTGYGPLTAKYGSQCAGIESTVQSKGSRLHSWFAFVRRSLCLLLKYFE